MGGQRSAASVPFSILFEDDQLLIVDKPSGMLVHRGWGNDPVVLVDRVRAYLGGGLCHPIHRLDRQTSGVVCFGKTPEIAAEMGRLFESGGVVKGYLALVRGVPPGSFVVDHPVPKGEAGRRVAAVTQFSLIETVQILPRALSLVKAMPRTGRLHQIRRHLKHCSFPIIGDANYGKGALNRDISARYGLARMGLHAAWLSFEHPVTGAHQRISAPIPEDLAVPLSRMGFAICLDEEKNGTVGDFYTRG